MNMDASFFYEKNPATPKDAGPSSIFTNKGDGRNLSRSNKGVMFVVINFTNKIYHVGFCNTISLCCFSQDCQKEACPSKKVNIFQ